MARQPVINVTIKAQIPYARKQFGATGDAETKAKAFAQQTLEAARETGGITITDTQFLHTSVVVTPPEAA